MSKQNYRTNYYIHNINDDNTFFSRISFAFCFDNRISSTNLHFSSIFPDKNIFTTYLLKLGGNRN